MSVTAPFSSFIESHRSQELLVLCCSQVLHENDVLAPATIVIDPSGSSGKILLVEPSIHARSAFPTTWTYECLDPYILMPGLVDAHVHLNEPGRTQWEGFRTGTAAAAFGGVTTVIDMPLNAIPPTTTVEGLKLKMAAARESGCWVDIGFHGGLVPANVGTGELKALVDEGVRGFKGFLCDSGVDEFPRVSIQEIQTAMAELAGESTTLMFHAEMSPPEPLSKPISDVPSPSTTLPSDLSCYSTFLQSRPSSWETLAISTIIASAHLAPSLPLHIVHLSAAEAIPLLRRARSDGVNITAETCFHYLAFSAEKVPDGDTRYKCCPPIREQVNGDRLWEEVFAEDSVIKTIVSDHSPCTPDLKLLASGDAKPGADTVAKPMDCDGVVNASPCTDSGSDSGNPSQISRKHCCTNSGGFLDAWGGISSLGLGLPILWTELHQRQAASPSSLTSESGSLQSKISHIRTLCSLNTAKQVGLQHRKATLAAGYDADICVFDPDAVWKLSGKKLLFKNKVTPYEGREFKGMVMQTWVRGRKVFQRQAKSECDRERSTSTTALATETRGLIGSPVGELLVEKRKF